MFPQNNFISQNNIPSNIIPTDSLNCSVFQDNLTCTKNYELKPRENKEQYIIDSRDRNYSKFPNNNNYSIKLKKTFKNIKEIKMVYANFPKSNISLDNLIFYYSHDSIIEQNNIEGETIDNNLNNCTKWKEKDYNNYSKIVINNKRLSNTLIPLNIYLKNNSISNYPISMYENDITNYIYFDELSLKLTKELQDNDVNTLVFYNYNSQNYQFISYSSISKIYDTNTNTIFSNIDDIISNINSKRIITKNNKSEILYNDEVSYSLEIEFNEDINFFSLYFSKGLGDYGDQSISKEVCRDENGNIIYDENCCNNFNNKNILYKEIRIGDKDNQDVENTMRNILGFDKKNYNLPMGCINMSETIPNKINRSDASLINKELINNIILLFNPNDIQDKYKIIYITDVNDEYIFYQTLWSKLNLDNSYIAELFNLTITGDNISRINKQPDYIIMNIDELSRYISLNSNSDESFALIPFHDNEDNCIIDNSENYIKEFNPPLNSLDKLNISFKNYDGSFYNFGAEHYFILEFKY